MLSWTNACCERVINLHYCVELGPEPPAKVANRFYNGHSAGSPSTSGSGSLSAMMGAFSTSYARSSNNSALPDTTSSASPQTSDADVTNRPKKARPKPVRTHHSVLNAHRNGTFQPRSPAVSNDMGTTANQNGNTSRSASESVDPELVHVMPVTNGAERDPVSANSTEFASGANHLSRPSSSQGSGPPTPVRLLGDFVYMLQRRSGVSTDAGTATTVHSGPVQSSRISGYIAPNNAPIAEDLDLDEDVIEISEERPNSSRVPSRSPSFELLTEEAFQRTTPAKKRKFSTMPPEDADTARGSRLLFAESAATTTDTETTPCDSPDGEELLLERIGGNPAFEVDAHDVAQSLEDELVVEAAAGTANRPEILPNPTVPSTLPQRSTPVSTTAPKAGRPSVFFKVPTAANIMANNVMTPNVAVDESTPFSVGNAPISRSAKGKEPIRSVTQFERKASPPIIQITTQERQQLWMEQAGIPFQASGSMDIDALLHAEDPEDDPFTATESDENAVAGPSFAYPAQESSDADKVYTHLLSEPRGSYGMSKDFDYRRFNEPLLDCINSLPLHAQNGSHIRVVLEAYYSQSSTDRAPPIKIDGGDRDEFPPAEFKYSDEVYYSDRVPKPWLGKGCECVGPCSENSECFCLKRQEMYFSSFVTDPMVGPLKGFAYNA